MTPCQNSAGETMSSCMGILQRQLLVVFTGKQMASLLKQYIKPKLNTRKRVNAENAEIIEKNRLRADGHKYPLEINNTLEREKFLAPYESNFDDFKEMSIQLVANSIDESDSRQNGMSESTRCAAAGRIEGRARDRRSGPTLP